MTYDWLHEALKLNHNRKFHAVEGPPADDIRQLIEDAWKMPPSYRQFVLQFGEAHFFREGGSYLLEIFRAPHQWTIGGEEVCYIGRTDSTKTFLKPNLDEEDIESPVYELFYQGGLQKTADSFDQWLAMKWRSRTRRFRTKANLQAAMTAAEPFTAAELAIVAARRQFVWRSLGMTEDGGIRVEITNNSTLQLPYLSIGVAGVRQGSTLPASLIGWCSVEVRDLQPGQSVVLEMGAYKSLARHFSSRELVERPDPDPEDRELYCEFRTTPDPEIAR